MNDSGRGALAQLLGARFSEEGALGVARPSSEAELIELLSLMRQQGLHAGSGLRIDRSLFDSVLRVNAPSGILEVGAGMTLDAVERVAQGHRLTLGSLSPGARRLRVGEFLEGPYAGLRAIPGGRLEPLAMSLRAVLANGQLFRSPSAPRSAAGPGLDQLFLGGRGRLGLILSAELRALPVAVRTEHVTLAFPTAEGLVQALRSALDDGAVIADVHLHRRGSLYLAHSRFAGTDSAAVRDANTLARRAAPRGGRLMDPDLPVWAAQSERELSWPQVAAELEAGRPLRLHRLAVVSVVAELTTPAAAEAEDEHRALWNAVAQAADPEAVLRGEA